jgi:S-adenosylmethionine hydrolase
MKPSGIITLATDFGLTDPYVAMMKGVILSINPDVRLVDISHQIKAGSILQAAGIIRETFLYFPIGTIHVAVVDPGVGSTRRLMGLEAGDHLFVGPDNGIFWPLIRKFKKAKAIHLTESRYFLSKVRKTFHGREVFSPVAAHLSLGVALEEMGTPMADPIRLELPAPSEKGGILYGQIIRVDNFGNLITNISANTLDQFLKKAPLHIQVGNLAVKELSHVYSDAAEGEPLALINSSDWLEVAVNLGRASEYAGLDSGEAIGTPVKVSRSEGNL